MSKGRVEAFSDGVFAVAITILIFNVQVHKAAPGGLLNAIWAAWPTYAAYVASFLSIGVIWINHHALFERLAHVDRSLVFLNLLLLMSVVFLPFPTALLGENIEVAGDAATAATVYAVVAVVLSSLFSLMWVYALRHPRLLDPDFDAQAAWQQLPRYGFGFLVYLICVPVSRISPILVVILFAGVAVYYAFERLPEFTRGASN